MGGNSGIIDEWNSSCPARWNARVRQTRAKHVTLARVRGTRPPFAIQTMIRCPAMGFLFGSTCEYLVEDAIWDGAAATSRSINLYLASIRIDIVLKATLLVR